ncbi:putative Hybrid PKS-NRPS biosynthetic cluster [Trichoglossum hirsutum]|uniref:Hybrid PKS-NRPS biosynthetic cluster n=1 Tax=Trichoglossum hirsutum TaxID=265104 RepID=A0A9P8LHX9_9PEZI|nr:putative Hybrid PKS-NRPS biosynthetic cluster [Trichoglossum hirsutum]
MTSLTKRGEPIAVVGSGCRFPGESSSPAKLWELLQEPRDLVADIPSVRFNSRGFYHHDGEHHGSTNVTKSYLLSEDHRLFDAAFYNINPREAEALDPQQRLLLETVYEALESAGFSIEGLQGSQTSVFAGLMSADYYDIQLRDVDTSHQYQATGTARSILSNRISYFFDWRGPSVTIDTACSSSLVAVHQAVQSLRSGESSLAVAVGANLILGPEQYISESKLHMLSPGGRSKMWDASADGYGRGEGFAAVILKTLNQALKDGDHIECIIRETGVNQDGRTTGITMPSATSQAALIRQTYERAGLDWRKKSDRCQYFEAHGTGTPAGDPIEAEAVRNVFFDTESGDYADDDILFVGSIKTVIGHLEGSAGLAGILKASLALKHRVIPPNMHFCNLNPSVKPFYQHLRIPTACQKWPAVPAGSPRRASVNSFGFGGTNAHAIIESYDANMEGPAVVAVSAAPVGPFTFSAQSERSLLGMLEAFSKYLKGVDSVNLSDLAWTLQSRRSNFPIKAAFSGLTREKLASQIDLRMEATRDTPGASVGTRSMPNFDAPRVLGIFTGQGAQWPSMGRELLVASQSFRQSIVHLERSLRDLPDPPTWSLQSELMAEGSSSRVGEAEVSQPLCTAVQVALVDILKHARVSLDAVVGHSSGEIAAAYAAGMITSGDAIRIAYYRGLYAKLARGPTGCKGAMMAVGIPFDEASAFCARPQFMGRISVAASNAPASVTLSGDDDAIREAKNIFDKDRKFARLLKVDTAYHSLHMKPCSKPYLRSLQACHIQVQPQSTCIWFSSVRDLDGTVYDDLGVLKDSYWRDNMTSPVLFSQAIERAIGERGHFDIAVEIGPHPALKGPVTQTINQIAGVKIPYNGLLNRGSNDIEAVSDAISFVWAQLGASSVDFDGYRLSFTDLDVKPKLLKDLPSYPWDHGQIFWKESRISRNFRTREDPSHELLGARCPGDTEQDRRWRNILRLNEIPWLRGHQFQHQVVFPAAGYVAMALEASKSLFGGRPGEIIELRDIVIHKAITLEEDSAGVETLFSLKRAENTTDNRNGSLSTATADFACYANFSQETDTTDKIFSGRVVVMPGGSLANSLPSRDPEPPYMNDINMESFYSSMSEIGLDYTGLFRQLTSAKRRMHRASATALAPPTTLVVHPALLDLCFQTVFIGYCWPNDGSLRTSYLPTSIRRILVNTSLREAREGKEFAANVDSYITRTSTEEICGDVDMFSGKDDALEIQVEGLTCSSFSQAENIGDRMLYSQTVWNMDISSGETELSGPEKDPPEVLELVDLCERLTYFYLRYLSKEIGKDEASGFKQHHQTHIEFIDYILPLIANGKHPTTRKEWAADTREQLLTMAAKFPESVDLALVRAVGENLPSIMRGEVDTLSIMLENDMLGRFYKLGLGFTHLNGRLARIASQLAHRYPHMKILELGAGTGGTTASVLRALGGAFSSYTFTDVSTGFFEKAREQFQTYANKMKYMVLDLEKDVAEQDYAENSFDLIIASNVLHATKTLADTLNNVRRLLKPGGYLLLIEITGAPLRAGFIMSGLPGWWLGANDGRRFAPTISPVKWDSLLRSTGFSGIDTIEHDLHDTSKYMTSFIVSQALDDRINFLRQPTLAPLDLAPVVDRFIIVGGKTLHTAKLVRNIHVLLRSLNIGVVVVDALDGLQLSELSLSTAVLCLTEMDEPIFESMSPEKLRLIQGFFNRAGYVLWVTHGCRADSPYSNMTVGLGRTLLFEMPHVRLQFLDIGSLGATAADAGLLTDTLLRLVAADSLGEPDSLLWSTEPELAFDNGKLFIPRVRPMRELNNRLNALRRPATKNVSPETTAVDIVWSGSSYFLRESRLLHSFDHPTPGYNTIRVTYSLLSALRITAESLLFLCFGVLIETGERVIALSKANGSIIETPITWTLPADDIPFGQEEQYIWSVADNLVAQAVLSSVPANGTIVLHELDMSLASLIARRAGEAQIKAIFTTSRPPPEDSSFWTFIHPYSSERRIRSMIPTDVDLFIDVSETAPVNIGSRISACLPHSCNKLTGGLVSAQASKLNSDFSSKELRGALTQATLRSKSDSTSGKGFPEFNKVRPSDILDGKADRAPISVVDWSETSPLPVRVAPSDPKGLFSKDKTYLLIGLTGDLGLSLCRWMATNGAKYFVLASRRPNIDSRWLEELQQLGATVKVVEVDISDKKSLHGAYDKICATMPPIGGVANGAMILSDQIFSDMSLEDFNSVLKPKVEGTKNLDELFSEESLEFFVLFSSLACIIGNPGQSNYNASNMFMTALAAQRRKRGLPASTFALGMVLGVGFFTRNQSLEGDSMRKFRFMPIPEPEFHQIFTEAVIAGRPESGQPSEIITGLKTSTASAIEEERAPWYKNPRFSHYVLEEDEIVEGKEGKGKILSVKQELELAKSDEEACQILQTCFSAKLGIILQLPSDNSINSSIPLVELGVDSLLSVEIRTWFLKELNVDIPALKILSSTSVADMCKDVISKLPTQFLPVTGAAPANKEPDEAPGLDASNAEAGEANTALSGGETTLSTEDSFGSSLDSQSDSSASSIQDTPLKSDSGKLNSDREPTGWEQAALQRVERMSHAQSRLWFLDIYLEDQATYNIVYSCRLKGPIQVSQLERALRTVAQRHESLRTCFFSDAQTGQAMQGILESSSTRLEWKHITDESEVDKEFSRIKSHIYSLERGETMLATLLSLSSDSHFLIFGYHHIIMDAVSWRTFIQDLDEAYRSNSLKRPIRQCAEFSAKQRHLIDAGDLKDDLAFWKSEYPDMPPVLPLFPFCRVRSRKALSKYDIHRLDMVLDSALVARVKQASVRLKTTAFHFYLSTFQVLLFRFLDATDFSIGIADSNRTDGEFVGSLGFFMNLLPTRFHLEAKQRFHDILKTTRDKTYAALSHSRLPFDVLLDELNVTRSSAQSPIFQAIMNYQRGTLQQSSLGDCRLEIVSVEDAKTAYDISATIVEDGTEGSSSIVSLTTQKYLYSSNDLNLIMKSYVHLLDLVSRDTSLPLDECSLFSDSDSRKGFELGRGSRIHWDWPETICHRVDNIVQKHPNRIAVKDGHGKILTYKQMAERIDAIAEALLAADVTPRSRVAVFCDPTADTVCSLLAILRVGAVYVPLDLRNPVQRLAVIVKNCEPSAILCHGPTIEDSPGLGPQQARIINLSTIVGSSLIPSPNKAVANSPAFVLYTSGSTGTPKGITLKHSNVLNQVAAAQQHIGMRDEVILQQSSLAFDMSAQQMLCALTGGGTVVVVPKNTRGDAVELAKLIQAEKVTCTMCTPSEYSVLLRFGSPYLANCSSWRIAITGGEILTNQLKQQFQNLGLQHLLLFDVYGPTEVSWACSVGKIPYDDLHANSEGGLCPIGPSQPNYSVYIVDEHLRPVPVGFPGEVCIGGAGVSSGYLNNDKLTEKKYIPDPFATADDIARGWDRMYRSGDRGRLNADGSLIFLARMDGGSQIKLRGLRIELDDVTNTILHTADGILTDAAISVRGDPAFLVAFVVVSQEASLSDTRQFLKQLLQRLPLPQYMRPAEILPLDRLPMNQNGKIDRSALDTIPLPRQSKSDTESSILSTLESQLAAIWEEILPNDAVGSFAVGRDSDFFYVGGNSLLLVRLQSLIHESFHISIPLVELFQDSTLGGIASRISTKCDQDAPAQAIDWDYEISVPKAELHSAVAVAPKFARPIVPGMVGKVVLLTGSTGFLGKAILRQLVADSTVRKVHCVAIRSSGQLGVRRLPIESDKIETHAGNLSMPRLGLSETEFATLSQEIDAIIHNGADVSFLKSYPSLRKPNVGSTKELVKLALPRKIPFHFVSTSGVAHLSSADSLAEVSVAELRPSTDGSNGYTASKWASEAFLEHVAEELGLPTWIHRPTNIFGEGVPATDIMQNVRYYSLLMNAVPSMEDWRGYFDLVHVDTVAVDVVREVLGDRILTSREAASGGKTFMISHHCSDTKMPVHELKYTLEKESGNPFETLTMHEWVSRAGKRGLDRMVGSFLETAVAGKDHLAFPMIMKSEKTGM